MKLRLITRRLLCRIGIGCAGHVEHEKDAKGVWWVGLRCVRCGKLCSPIRSAYQDQSQTKEANK